MKNSMGDLVDKVKGAGRSWKNTARTGVLIGAGILGAMAGGAKGQTPVNSFADLMVSNHTNTIRMEKIPVYDNLMIRDPDTGIDSVVDGAYHLGLIKHEQIIDDKTKEPVEVDYVVGYAHNLSTITYPEREGWMKGKICNYLGDGGKADEAWLMEDPELDGLGTIYSNGVWVVGDDDTYPPFTSKDILFGPNQIRGDVSQLPAYSTAPYPENIGIIPPMVIKPHTDEQDLRVLGENWLRTDADSSNAWANGADWNHDGKVDNEDLAILASKYRPVVKAN